ncbi:MAG TPA: hypothetical protein VN937_16340 [Blastocatellia bacterium]|nr:hypothetical protein [Blastocatellia bacterium]
MMDFLYGVIGFAGFEALRVYKCLWADHPVLPLNKKYFYFVVVLVMGAFSGSLAGALSHGSVVAAIYIGFSVPTNIKAVLQNPRRTTKPRAIQPHTNDYSPDDIMVSSPGLWNYVRHYYFDYQ